MSAVEAETFHMPFVAYRVAKQQKTKRAKSNKKLVLPRRRILKCALFSGTARTEAGL